MNTTGKFLKNQAVSWRDMQESFLLAEEKRRKSLQTLPDMKAVRDMESAEKLDDMQLFSPEDLASLAAEMEKIPTLPINKTEYVRILSQGALNTIY